MEVPKTIDIASLFYFSGANRDGGKGAAIADADADAKTKRRDARDGYNSSNQQQQDQQDQQEEKKEADENDREDDREDDQEEELELEQMTMETLRPTWRDALKRSSVMANSIRHFVEPDVHTAMDRDIDLWIALEEDIMSLGSDDSNDLDYGADDDPDDDDGGGDDDESVSSGGSSELSDGGYIVDEPNPFGQMIVADKGKGSIVDDWTDDEEACSSDVSNWSDDNGGKKKKKKSKKAASAPAKSSNGSRKKVLVSSKSGTQKQLSAFGIKMTITNKTSDEGGGSGAKKRKSTDTTATTTAKKKKQRGKKKSPSTAAPNGKVRSEMNKKPYAIGSSIVLRNLTANDVAGLNGKRAVVRSGISDDGKQEIEVEGQEGLIPMKLENMRGVCPLFG